MAEHPFFGRDPRSISSEENALRTIPRAFLRGLAIKQRMEERNRAQQKISELFGDDIPDTFKGFEDLTLEEAEDRKSVV